MGSRIAGPARAGAVTKRLVTRIRPGDVAIISHPDLDAATASMLVARRPAAVVNGCATVSGRVPAGGAWVLLRAGIPVLDRAGPDLLDRVVEGMPVELRGDRLLDQAGRVVAEGWLLTPEEVRARLEEARGRLPDLLRRFVDNTLQHAARERDRLMGPIPIPPLRTPVAGRPAVVVARGAGFREDLRAIEPFIRRHRPVLVGVDGGADGLLELGLPCDLIVGDMDSVSDRALERATELVVQAYPGGPAPGLARVLARGRFAHVFPCPGTSEDAALLLAGEAGARPVVAVGTHASALDVMEKGRPGMASTLLVRMRLGHVLVDARGYARLGAHEPDAAAGAGPGVAAAAMVCLSVAAWVSGPLQQLARLFWLRLQAGFWAGLWP